MLNYISHYPTHPIRSSPNRAQLDPNEAPLSTSNPPFSPPHQTPSHPIAPDYDIPGPTQSHPTPPHPARTSPYPTPLHPIFLPGDVMQADHESARVSARISVAPRFSHTGNNCLDLQKFRRGSLHPPPPTPDCPPTTTTRFTMQIWTRPRRQRRWREGMR